MRDPKRLDVLYAKLCETHKENFPDWRFGQFMSNFFSWLMQKNYLTDIFFPEDDKWMQWLDEYVGRYKK